MSESHARSPETIKNVVPDIPIEVVSDEEMAIIEAALAATRCSLSAIRFPSHFQRNARSITSITVLSKRRLSGCGQRDIEDSCDLGMTQKRKKVCKSLLERFRKKRGLSVTDLTGSEWCEKQMEFFLLFGGRRVNKAMRAGQARHEKLEAEVTRKVKIQVQSSEDAWAIKFLNSIKGLNQLLFERLTRELQLCGLVEGVWMVGVIDEIRMPAKEIDGNPILVDTKTRERDTLPAESQRRNGRLQLMCYKYMWDDLAAGNFPSRQFFNFFSLNPNHVLSEKVRESAANEGFPVKTLDDMVRLYRDTWNRLPPAARKLLLRYEFQKDQSLLAEDYFAYDYDWLKVRIQGSLEFWKGEREASHVQEEERWKCHYCQFASVCPANLKPESTPHSSPIDSNTTPS